MSDEFDPLARLLQADVHYLSASNFARTIKLLEQHREPHVQRAVNLMCLADSPPDSSERFFTNAQTVRDAMGQFDQATHTCSHVTKHGQTGGRIRYVCESVCFSQRTAVLKKPW